MKDIGNLDAARTMYVNGESRNLNFLLENRFTWMNSWIDPKSDRGVELGSGIAASKDFINASSFLTTDFVDSDWLDIQNCNAISTDFEDHVFDFVVACNTLHHIAYPSLFLKEMSRILKPNGVLLIQEIHTSFLGRLILKVFRHESFDERIDVFNKTIVVNDPNDPWSANCSVPSLLFRSHEKFEENFREFKIVHDQFSECLVFLNSGGVTAKTFHVPLNLRLLSILFQIDRVLVKMAPNLLAIQRQVVLQNRSN
jgi:SAM-dependent methyltransferase